MSIKEVFSKDYFEGKTSNYGPGYLQKRVLDLSFMKGYKELLSNGIGLDLCCGNGYWLSAFKKLAGSYVVGIDIGSWILKKDVYGNKDSVILGDARKLPFKEKCFAWVFCNQSLEHFKRPKEVICAIFNVLSRNSIAFITVPHRTIFSRFTEKDRTHVSVKSLKEWKQLFQEIFLKVDVFVWYDRKFYERNFPLLPLFLKKLIWKFLPVYCYIFVCKKRPKQAFDFGKLG